MKKAGNNRFRFLVVVNRAWNESFSQVFEYCTSLKVALVRLQKIACVIIYLTPAVTFGGCHKFASLIIILQQQMY